MELKLKQCWKCGHLWEYRHTPGVRDECEKCLSPLHVCRNCRFFREGNAQWCNEPAARDEVPQESDTANRCSFFVFSDGGGTNSAPGSDKAKKELASLFGDEAQNNAGKSDDEEKPDWMKFDKPDHTNIFKPPDRD